MPARPRPLEDRFWEKVCISSSHECWEWQSTVRPHGYGVIREGSRVSGDPSGGRFLYAHRVSWTLESGTSVPDGMQVCHHCDNRKCVNPRHLFLGTISDNMADKVAKGRNLRGEQIRTAKLKSADVIAIRNERGLLTEIASRYGISFQHVSDIKSRKRWAHI